MAKKTFEEQQDEQIMKNFKDHVATHHSFAVPNNGTIEYLRWAKPNTSVYSVNYYRHNGMLAISGDLYCAVHCWNYEPTFTLSWIAGCDFGYYMSKMAASQHGRDGKVWSVRAAEKRLLEMTRDFTHITTEQWEEVHQHVNEKQEWEHFLSTDGSDFFGPDCFEYADIGMEYDWLYRAHWLGLREAVKQAKLV